MINSISNKVSEIIIEIYQSNKAFLTQEKIKNFIEEALSPCIEEVDWVLFCNKAQEHSAYKFAFWFLCLALRDGISFGKYSMYLYQNKECYERLREYPHVQYKPILCGKDITKQIVCYNAYGERKNIYIFVDTNNEFLKSLIYRCMCRVNHREVQPSAAVLFHFAKSFGEEEIRITSLDDLRCAMIFQQTQYYQELFKSDQNNFKQAVTFLCFFYRWLVNEYSDRDFFTGCYKITRKLLFAGMFKKYLMEGYYFTVFSPSNIPAEHEKVVFTCNGFDRLSTKYLSEDFFAINLSHLHSQEYRKLILSYVLTQKSFTSSRNTCIIAAECLENLYQIKIQEHYPNKHLLHFTTPEAQHLKAYISRKDYASTTKGARISDIKRFFEWCGNAGLVTFEYCFFDELTTPKGRQKGKAKAIPDDELVKINTVLREDSNKNLREKLMYAIFHLAVFTEFRISQICHLKIDAIVPTVKPGEYTLRANNKTSFGDVIENPITEQTYRLLRGVINDTDTLRNTLCPPELKRYIFIYQAEHPKKVTVMRSDLFRQTLKSACKKAGLPQYTASNLRDTYMTKAWEFVMSNGKSNMELSLLTKHRHIDTTMSHYVELELEKMLEATYGVEIGENLVDAKSKVVEEMPEILSDEALDVEHGCGKCAAKQCTGTAALSCLVCKNFVTTPKHKPYFEKMIEITQKQIENTKNKHEKEDLTTIKTLYVLYLKAIYSFEESKNG